MQGPGRILRFFVCAGVDLDGVAPGIVASADDDLQGDAARAVRQDQRRLQSQFLDPVAADLVSCA